MPRTASQGLSENLSVGTVAPVGLADVSTMAAVSAVNHQQHRTASYRHTSARHWTISGTWGIEMPWDGCIGLPEAGFVFTTASAGADYRPPRKHSQTSAMGATKMAKAQQNSIVNSFAAPNRMIGKMNALSPMIYPTTLS